MSTIGIFNGKQKIHNKQALTLLYNNEPLTTWEMAKKLTNVGNRRSLNSTLNKSMRKLETEGYVKRKDDDKWYLQTKGFIAVISVQQEPKRWNNKWETIFMDEIKTNDNNLLSLSTMFNYLDSRDLTKISKIVNEILSNFENWIKFSKTIEKNKINIDNLSDQQLISMLVAGDPTLISKLTSQTFDFNKLSEFKL